MAYKHQFNQSVAARQHYEKNKADYKRRAQKHSAATRKRCREFILDYLACHPCVDCSESDIRVLDFDHVRGKKVKEISNMVRDGNSFDSILREIDKCEIRCANCHRKRTHETRRYHRNTTGKSKSSDGQLLLPI